MPEPRSDLKIAQDKLRALLKTKLSKLVSDKKLLAEMVWTISLGHTVEGFKEWDEIDLTELESCSDPLPAPDKMTVRDYLGAIDHPLLHGLFVGMKDRQSLYKKKKDGTYTHPELAEKYDRYLESMNSPENPDVFSRAKKYHAFCDAITLFADANLAKLTEEESVRPSPQSVREGLSVLRYLLRRRKESEADFGQALLSGQPEEDAYLHKASFIIERMYQGDVLKPDYIPGKVDEVMAQYKQARSLGAKVVTKRLEKKLLAMIIPLVREHEPLSAERFIEENREQQEDIDITGMEAKILQHVIQEIQDIAADLKIDTRSMKRGKTDD